MREEEKVLYWILAGTTGGYNRIRILRELLEKPQNTNMLSKKLELDFKTVQHHLNVLEKNRLVTFQGGGGFSKIYFPSEMVEENRKLIQKIENDSLNEENKKK
jgi:DNA-binding transcriptional ArsR family regulator